MSINTRPDIHEQVVCANMFIKKGGKYLVLRRSLQKKYAPGVIHPVGGKVELSENPQAAAVRETLEETGLTVKNIRLEAVFLEIQPHLNEPYNWLIFHFSGDFDSGEIQQTEEGELILLSEEELKAENLFPSVRLAINHILSKEQGTVFATFEYDDEKKNIVKQTYDFCVVG